MREVSAPAQEAEALRLAGLSRLHAVRVAVVAVRRQYGFR
jgi:hypothetical protein